MTPPVSKHAVTFVIIAVFRHGGLLTIMPVLPTLFEDLGHMTLAGATVIGGWMVFAFAFTQLLFSPLIGNLFDRFGRRPLLLVAVFGLGIDYRAPRFFAVFAATA